MPCINCNTEFDSDFCPTCGEKKNVDRITFSSISQSIFVGILDMDKGFLYNLKNLTLQPKITILNYLNGKRRYILNPISYAIITISIYLFLDSILPRGAKPKLKKVDLYGMQKIGMNAGYFLRSKMKFFWLLFPLYTAVFSKLFFRKYNFFEHLAVNFFIVGHATLLAILSRIIYNKEILIFNILVFTYINVLLYKFYKNPKDKFGSGALGFIIVFFSYILFLGIPLFLANYKA